MFGASEEMRIEHLQNNAMEFVYLLCSIACQPVEILLRPWYGTRYYSVPVTFFSSAMMLLLPAVMMLFTNFMSMIPLLHAPPLSACSACRITPRCISRRRRYMAGDSGGA